MHNPQPAVETERLRLRPVTADDLDRLHELDADPEVRRYLDQPTAPTRQESVRALHRFLVRHGPQGEPTFWAAEHRADGSFVGWFHLRPPTDGACTFDLGYRLRRAAWGQGYATEGARALLHRAFFQLGAECVVAHALEANLASRRVLEKVGFRLNEHFLHRGELPAVAYSVARRELLGGEASREFSRAEMANQLRALGVVPGGVLLVHTSFRAVRPVAGGPLGLIEALRDALGPEGTLVMPSWTGSDEEPFAPATTPASPDLGVVADTFWRLPSAIRSTHLFAFAAAGPRATQITSGPLPLPPHIPESSVGRVHDLDGQVLLLGVGHDADTTLHLAELLAGVPYRVPKYCTVLQDGRPVRVPYGENDHCCERFALADEWLRERGLQTEGPVGHAHARLARSRNIVDVARERLAGDPLLFLHPPDAGCEECDQARASVAG